MRRFADAEGTVWEIELLIGDIPRIEQETGVHFLRLDRPLEEDRDKWLDGEGTPMSGIQRLMFDLPLTYRVLYSICKEQAERECPTPRDFGRRISAVHQLAYDTLFEEIRDFFRMVRQNATAAFVGKQQEIIQAMQTAVEGMYENIDSKEMAREVAEKVESILGRKSGALQVEWASIPGD